MCFPITCIYLYLYLFCHVLPSKDSFAETTILSFMKNCLYFRAAAFPEVRSALAANRDLIDGQSPVSVLSLPLPLPPFIVLWRLL